MRHVGGKRQEDFHTVMCLKKKKGWKRSYSMFVKPCGFCSGHSVNFRGLAKGMVLEKPRYQLPRPYHLVHSGLGSGPIMAEKPPALV